MEEHIQKTIEDLQGRIARKRAEIAEIEQAISALEKLGEFKLQAPPAPTLSAPGPKKRKPRANRKGRYYGITITKNNKYRGQVFADGKAKHLGCFETEVLAAEAVDAFLISKGKPARNFPDARP